MKRRRHISTLSARMRSIPAPWRSAQAASSTTLVKVIMPQTNTSGPSVSVAAPVVGVSPVVASGPVVVDGFAVVVPLSSVGDAAVLASFGPEEPVSSLAAGSFPQPGAQRSARAGRIRPKVDLRIVHPPKDQA